MMLLQMAVTHAMPPAGDDRQAAAAATETAAHDDRPPTIRIDPTDGEQLVSVRDAAKIMGFAPRTVQGWVKRGLVEIRRTPVGQAMIVVRSLWRRESQQVSA